MRRPRRFLQFQARRYAEHANGSGHVAQDPPQLRNAIMFRISREDSYAFRRGALSHVLGDSFSSEHEDTLNMQTARDMSRKTPESIELYHAQRFERRQFCMSEGCSVRRLRRFLEFQARRYAEHANGSGHGAQDAPPTRNAIIAHALREGGYAARRGAQ